MKYLITIDFWKKIAKYITQNQLENPISLVLNRTIYYFEDHAPQGDQNNVILINCQSIDQLQQYQIHNKNNRQNDEYYLLVYVDIKKYQFSHRLLKISPTQQLTWITSQVKMIDLSVSMDPMEMLKNTAKNNLQLIKYRNAPSINLEKIDQTTCLIIGTGTLGCNIARNLLMWGIENITFIDNSVVSHSNLLRQSLFEYSDLGQSKAIAAAHRIGLIYPPAKDKVKGYCFNMPMPDHTYDGTIENLSKDLDLIDELINSHDIIFLCTDNKESRWLPTMIAVSQNKPLINIAVGFDTWVVMRHPINCEASLTIDTKLLSSDQLGCYFCTSIEGIENTIKDRLIDEKCTVTRGGTSFISSAYAVELMITLLNHSQQFQASAKTDCLEFTEFVIKYPPQQIRGNVNLFKSQHGLIRRNPQCCACSNGILKYYNDKLTKVKFIENVCKNGQTLSNITGLDKYILSSSNDNLVEIDDL